MSTLAAVALSPAERARKRQLVVTKRRATILLAAVSVVFVVATVWGNSMSWMGYVQATAAASMVGGLADWFAVTALFRHPLGVPIPHTAIVVERKDSFAVTLGEFIQGSFLTPELIVDRLRAADVVVRLAEWLAEPEKSSRVAAEAADAIVAITKLLREDDAHRSIEALLRQGVEAVPLAPLAGQALRFVTRDGRADGLFDQALRQIDRYLQDHRDQLRQNLATRSRWWLPGVIDHRLFDRVLDGVSSVVLAMADDHDHELRRQFSTRMAQLADDLETSPTLRQRGEQMKHDLLARPEVREWVAAFWVDLKGHLEVQAANPTSVLRQQLTGMFVSLGRRLRDDPAWNDKVQVAMESAASYVAQHFKSSIASLVSSTVARWNAEETATRLELLLGPDLQYVRINGTVVGAGAGLLLHIVARLIS